MVKRQEEMKIANQVHIFTRRCSHKIKNFDRWYFIGISMVYPIVGFSSSLGMEKDNSKGNEVEQGYQGFVFFFFNRCIIIRGPRVMVEIS